MQNRLRYELQDIISGKGETRYGGIIQTIAGYLVDGKGTSQETENPKYLRQQEEARLEEYIDKHTWMKGMKYTG